MFCGHMALLKKILVLSLVILYFLGNFAFRPRFLIIRRTLQRPI